LFALQGERREKKRGKSKLCEKEHRGKRKGIKRGVALPNSGGGKRGGKGGGVRQQKRGGEKGKWGASFILRFTEKGGKKGGPYY